MFNLYKRCYIKYRNDFIYSVYLHNDHHVNISFISNIDFALSFKSHKSAVRFLRFLDTLSPGFSKLCEVI